MTRHRAITALVGILCTATLQTAGCAATQQVQVVSALEARNVTEALAAYERMREAEGADSALLARIAALILESEALADNHPTQDASFSQLTAAGTAAHPTLQRLADDDAHPRQKAHALSILASHGDAAARAELRALLDSDDSDIRAYALASVNVVDDAPTLAAALAHTSGAVRLAAANVSAQGPLVPELVLALTDASRNDPLPSVRAACVRALSRGGSEAVEALRERLSDPSEAVRMAAVGALAVADRVRAREILTSLLAMGPNSASIEAARVLAMPIEGDDRGVVDARAFLLRGLRAAEPALRTQSAVALAGLPSDASMNDTLLSAMENDADASVKLLLAATMLTHVGAEQRARAVLHSLFAPMSMNAVQAAAALAKEHDREAMHVLAVALRDSNAAYRRVSARAVARDAMLPDLVRRALADEDAMVRIVTAGAILSAESAR